MKEQLTLDNIQIAYGKTTVIENCSFTLPQGRILSLLGASGCGKSTLLKAIAGLLPVQAGKIELNNTLIAAPNHLLSPEKNKVGMIFQDYALFPHLTVLQNVAFGLYKLPRKVREEKAKAGLELVQLSEFANRYPHELSGGQQQRVSIVRALVCEPTVLLFDEPFSNLDVSVRTTLMQDIKSLLKSRRVTAIFVTHDRTESLTMADEIAIMRQGTIAQIGKPQELYDAPIDREIAEFLGSGVVLSAEKTVGGWQTDLGLISTPDTNKVIVWKNDNTQDTIYLRPHQLLLKSAQSNTANYPIIASSFQGDFQEYTIQLPSQNIQVFSTERFAIGEHIAVVLSLD